ncbi:TetR/AcrR family transcriptional regulator [Lachnospiraceae bacterium 54-53]
MEKREDLRSIKSKMLIKRTFLDLMQESGYQHITIAKLSRKAMINRKTFYFHYETLEDLYEEITDEYLHLLDFSPLISSTQIELSQPEFLVSAVSALEKIKEQKELFKTLLEDPTNNRFNDKLKDFLSSFLLKTLKLTDYAISKKIPETLIQSIYSDIFLEITKWWINQDNISASEAINILVSMLSDNMLDALGLHIIP